MCVDEVLIPFSLSLFFFAWSQMVGAVSLFLCFAFLAVARHLKERSFFFSTIHPYAFFFAFNILIFNNP
jgi:hypothetical protein